MGILVWSGKNANNNLKALTSEVEYNMAMVVVVVMGSEEII